jgi:FemAB-related protein (PEP-CTERM system-associated)
MECLIREDFDPQWDEFVGAHPAGTFFHLWGWRDVLTRSFDYEPYYICAEEGGEILGVLPLFLVRSLLFGKSLVTIPLGVYGGPVAKTEIAEMALLQMAIEIAGKHRARYLEIRGNPYRSRESLATSALDIQPYKEKDLYVTFIAEIDPSPEVNMSRIPRKQRRMIRQGQKNGLKAVIDNSRLREWYDVYAESVRNLGTPVYSFSYFQRLVERFGQQCKVLLVEFKNHVVAAVLTFLYKDQILPYYGGALREYFHLAPNDFMYWELLSYGAENGYRIFDFGRSKKGTGSFDFKRHWGFEPRPLPYWYQSMNGYSVPDTSPMNPKLQWAIRVWRNLPLALTKGLGPHISRHIP